MEPRRNIYAEYLTTLRDITVEKNAQLVQHKSINEGAVKPTLLSFLGGKVGAEEKRPFDSDRRELVFANRSDLRAEFEQKFNAFVAKLKETIEARNTQGKITSQQDLAEFSDKLLKIYKEVADEIIEGIDQVQETDEKEVLNKKDRIVEEVITSYIFNAIAATKVGSSFASHLCNRIAAVHLQKDFTSALFVEIQAKVSNMCDQQKFGNLTLYFQMVGPEMMAEMLNEHFNKLSSQTRGTVGYKKYGIQLLGLKEYFKENIEWKGVIANISKNQILWNSEEKSRHFTLFDEERYTDERPHIDTEEKEEIKQPTTGLNGTPQ